MPARRRIALLSLCLSAACSRNIAPSAMSLSPRDKVIRVLEVGIGTANPEAIRELLVERVLIGKELAELPAYFAGDAYVEHDPLRKDGVAALVAALGEAPAAAAALVHEQVLRVVGEGNFVLVQSRGRKADVQAVIYDMFRVANDKLVEHWLVFERVPAKADNGNGMF